MLKCGVIQGIFWLQLIFLHSHLCRRWIFPVTQLETSLSSMTTLLVHRHGAHVPFYLVTAHLLPTLLTWREGAADGVNVWRELLRAPYWFCALKLTDMIGLQIPSPVVLVSSWLWTLVKDEVSHEVRVGQEGSRGQECQRRSSWSCNHVHKRHQRWAKILSHPAQIV